MARHAPDTFSSPATSSPATSNTTTPAEMTLGTTLPAQLKSAQHIQAGQMDQVAARAVVILSVFGGLGIGTLLMLALAGPAPERLQQDAELAGLVRSMVLVKGIIMLAALSLVTWRLGRPIARLPLLGYAVSLGVSAAALAWMWSLNAIPIAALVFYSGLISGFFTASRDHFLPPSRPNA